jgi:YNFM family putative membrane transporter
MSEPAPLKEPSETSLGTLVFVLGACGFASTFTMRLIDPLVPTLAAHFGTSIAQVAVMATAFSFSYAFGQPILGPIADAVGKVRTIGTCLALLVLLSIACSFAPNFEALLALRAASGIVAGGIIPIAMAAIGDRATMAQRQITLGRFTVIMIFGQMAGAACSGVIAEYAGWRGVFLMAGGIAALAFLMLTLTMRPRANAVRRRPTLGGAIASYAAVFSNPRSKLLYALVITEGSLIFGMPPFVAAILQERAGIGPSLAGLVIAGTGIGGLIYGLSTRILVDRIGPARMPVVGGVLMAIGYGLFALPFLPWWSAVPFFVVNGFGFFLMHGTFQAQATELAPGACGSAVSLFACSLFAGHALGPVLMGTALHLFGTTVAVTLFAIGIGLLGFAAPRILPMLGATEAQRPR